jgi:hypothetical protein
MQMPVHTCSYKGGMNKDLSFNEYPNVCYFDAENLRVIVDSSEGGTTTAMSTPKGHSQSFILPDDMALLGYVVLRNYLILLTHNTVGITDPDRIYKIALSSLTGTLPPTANIVINDTYFPVGGNLVYKADLGFDALFSIRVVANYENTDVQKIYWVDGLNTLKHLNTIHNDTYNDLYTLDPELLEILPNHTYGTYTLAEGIGGHLKAGRIQYSYQLYSISGSETMFAPPSNLYNLTSSNTSDGEEFVGSELETEVNKSIQVTLTLPSGAADIFNRIRLVALTYEEYNDTPIVRIVAEQELSGDTLTITDYGNSIGEIVLEEFQTIKNDLVPETIESKNNYLFAANITEQFFDVDETVIDLGGAKTFLDTRAYRWRYILSGATAYGSQIMNSLNDPAYTVIDGQPGFEVQRILGVYQISLTDSQWTISVVVGAEDDAANYHLPEVRTITSAGITGSFIVLYLHHMTGGWSPIPLLLSGMGTSYYTAGAVNKFYAYGFSYAGTKPSGLGHPINEYDMFVVPSMTYTYNYSYSTTVGSVDCVLNKGLTGELVVDPTDYTLVPEDHDCINIHNNITNDITSGNEFKYKYPLAGDPPVIGDLGGTGPYISYEFITEELLIAESNVITFGEPGDTEGTRILCGKSTSSGYMNPQTVLSYTGYQRGEVYRFGIVFYDLKGRPSFTKWIADVRFPEQAEELDPNTTWGYFPITDGVLGLTDSSMNGYALGIKFTIDWDSIDTDYSGLLDQLSGFQIVRMPRSDVDCTIKAQGLIVPTALPDHPTGQIEDANYSTYEIASVVDYEADAFVGLTGVTAVPPEYSMTRDLVELLSPEIAINKSLTMNNSTDFLEIVGRLHFSEYTGADRIEVPAASGELYNIVEVSATAVSPYKTTSTLRSGSWRRIINDAIVSLPEKRTGSIHMIDTRPYVARGYDGDLSGSAPEMSYKGTSLVAKIDSVFTNTNNDSRYSTVGISAGAEAMYGRYRRYLGYSQYGGNSYNERSYNSYIKVSEFTVIPDPATTHTESYSLYNGDVYICPFNFMKLFADADAEYDKHTGQMLVSFPIESRINTSMLLNSVADLYSDSAFSFGKFFLAEKQSIGITNFPNGYPECGDLYRYNSAYSAIDVSKVYPSKPFDFRSEVEKDVIITSSEPKINGEYSDSWLDFKYNNYIELEGEYGGITRIINNNDRLMAFQPRGISVLSVNERELVQTNNTAALAVGDGGILSRYDYLSRTVGTSFYDAICPTELGMYFYSDKQNGIYRILEQLEPLSDTKGMKSYFETTPWTGCITAYDKANREILFTPPTGDTLVFSGYIDAFEGFFTICPEKYITFDKYILSSLDKNRFYIHNFGNYTEYYGIDQTSTLTLVANPGKTNVASFHVIEWMTDLTEDGDEVNNYTFDELQVTNTHQDTDVIDLNTYPDLIKRFRKWRINTFRSNDKGRIRDSWIKAVFTFYQSYNNRKLVVHPINFLYVPTKLW